MTFKLGDIGFGGLFRWFRASYQTMGASDPVRLPLPDLWDTVSVVG